MEGADLGSVILRLYGDRSALDRELATLKRYTDALERRGVTIKFDADTGKVTREVDGLKSKLAGLNDLLRQVSSGVRGDADAWGGLGDTLGKITGMAGDAGGGLAKLGGSLGGVLGVATKAIPILGQIGLAAQGLQAIFTGVTSAVNAVIGPLTQLSQEAGRFNQQVAEASIFTTRAFAVLGPDGKAIQGTANQMRAVRGVIAKEYTEIQKEVAKISGATSSQIYEGFNLILQNSASLGKQGESLENIRKLATGIAAATNVLGVPGEQLRSEVNSLLTGDIQVYDQLAQKLYGPGARDRVKQLIAEGKYYDDLSAKLKKLYEGQEVLSNSLSNVKSNFDDVNQRIQTEGGQSLERGLAKYNAAILEPYTNLQGSFIALFRSFSESAEPLLGLLGQIGGLFVSIGAACSAALAPLGDVFALWANILGLGLGQALELTAKQFQLIAKVIEVFGKAVSATIRPWTAFLRVTTDLSKDNVGTSFFDFLIEKLDELSKLIDKVSDKAQNLQRDLLRQIAGASETLKAVTLFSDGGAQITEAEKANIQNAGNRAVANFNLTQGDSTEVELRSLQLSQDTTRLLEERQARLGAGKEKELNLAKEESKLVADRVKNEIQGLEQSLRLLQAKKTYQEALNALAESQRGLESSRASFSVQVAGSPEARLQAEDRRNTLINNQEQQRISERAALLGTERELLQTQLKIQLKQQKIQEDQLRIQKLEIQIQREKAVIATNDIAARARSLNRNSSEFKALQQQYKEAKAEFTLRKQQLEIINQTISLTGQLSGIIRETNGLEEAGIDIREQQLGIQRQQAGETRAQQAVLTELQRREQAINTAKEKTLETNRKQIAAEEVQQRAIEKRLKALQDEEKSNRAKLELQQAQNAAATQEAEARLKLAQLQSQASAQPTSIEAVLAARIEALALGTRGFVSEADATRRLYEARQQQLQDEQAQQRAQLAAQQERERAELQLQVIKLNIEKLRALNTKAELEAEKEKLKLQQQRDGISMTGSTVPPAPVLPPPPGGTTPLTGAIGNMLPRTSPAPNFNDGVGAPRGGRLHEGQDLGVDASDPIAARRAGRVVDAYSTGFGQKGGAVVIKYDDGTTGTYGHITPGANIQPGMMVAAGQQIGVATPWGNNTHLHYELRNALGLLMNPLMAIRQSLAQQPGVRGRGNQQMAGSLSNSMDSNENRTQENSESLKSIDETLNYVNTKLLPELLKGQGLQTQALNVSQKNRETELRNQQIRDQVLADALKTPQGRLAGQLSEATAGYISSALRGYVQQAVSGKPVDLQALASSLIERLTTSFLDSALAPLEKLLTENLFELFGGIDVDKAAQQQIDAANSQQKAAAAQQRAADTPIKVEVQTSGNPVAPQAPVSPAAEPNVKSIPVISAAPPTTESNTNTTGAAPQAVTPASGALAVTTASGALAQSLTNAAKEVDMVKPAATKTASGFATLFQSLVSLGGLIAATGSGGTDPVVGSLLAIGGSILSSILFKTPLDVSAVAGGAAGGGSSGPTPVVPVPSAPLKARAVGGPTAANEAYLTGEYGREIWLADRPGTVLPNNLTEQILGGGTAGGVNSVVNVTISDSGSKVDESQASMLGRMVEAAVLNVISREQRTGGVLARR